MVGPELENAMLANMKRKVEKKLVEGQLKKGKKRARDSSAKEDEAPSKRKKEKKEKKKKSSKLDAQHAKIDRRSTFKDEIIALGGTEEDLELVDAVESESEIEGSADKSLDKDLLRALKKLSKELGMLNAASKYGEAPSDESTPGDDLEDEEAAVKTPKSTAKPPKESIRKHDKSGLIFSPTTEWHKVALPDIPATKHRHYHERDIIERLQKYGRELLDEDNKQYELKISSSQQAFYATVMKSGTLSDKISALTLSVQESPVHNVRALESLVGLAKKRSRAQAVEVLRALKDLCAAGSLLPSDRRLRTFVMQPGLGQIPPKSLKRWTANSPLPEPLERAHLVAWVYEDWLKATYFEIMKIIETWSTDEVVFARSTVVDYIFELLKEKPEQEENLLRLLVNKLGDKEKKIASRASYNLLQLQIPHPAMRSVILSAIESDIIFRSGQSLHAKYYAIITLNQTVLSSKQQDVVVKILDIYFTLFHSLLTKPQAVKKEVQPTITPAYNKKGQRQGGGGKPGKKALEKQQQDEDKGKAMEDQIRERILAAILTGVNRAFPYASTDHEFFDKHIDTLFLLTHSSNFNTGIQALMLIQQLCQSHPATSERFYRTLYESLLDPRVMTTSKTALYLNLIYRALKADLNINRVKAFVKRLFQIAAVHQPSFACAVLYLYRELEAIFPSLKQFIDLPEDDDSDDEVYHDVVEQDRAQNSTASEPKKKSRYDGKKRDPQWSNAEKSCLWELDILCRHNHPSVALFAAKLITHDPMPPKPDLETHSLIRFLDRFVQRNPRKPATGLHGHSIFQPLAAVDSSAQLVSAKAKFGAVAPVSSQSTAWKMDTSGVDTLDVAFQQYFSIKNKGKESAKKKKEKKKEKKRADESDSEDEDENEDEIWKALVDSKPDIEGDEEEESDLDLGDLEEAMDEEEEDEDEDEGGIDLDAADEPAAAEEESDADSFAVFDEDDEDVFGSDEDLPSDLDDAFQKELEFADGKTIKDKGGREKASERKRRLKNLPTFASADDYAALLGDEEEEESYGG